LLGVSEFVEFGGDAESICIYEATDYNVRERKGDGDAREK